MKRTAFIFILLFVFFLIACVAPVVHNTNSGRPEITIAGKVGDQAIARIMDRMLSHSYSVKTATNNFLVFEKPIDNIWLKALMSSRYDSTPIIRTTFSIIEIAETTRIVIALMAVSNSGSAFERITSLDNNQASVEAAEFLNNLKTQIENANNKHKPTSKKNKKQLMAK